MSWTDIVFSNSGLTLICTAAAYGLVALFHFLQNRYSIDAERWGGLIADAFNFAEKEGLLHSLDGTGKLDAALTRFEAQFAKVYAGQPTLQDITDATLDLAKLALMSKFKSPSSTTGTVNPAPGANS
jgi:hypothetical protein